MECVYSVLEVYSGLWRNSSSKTLGQTDVGTIFRHNTISMNRIWSAPDGLCSSAIGNCGLLAALCFGSEEIVTPVWHHDRNR